MIRLTGLLARDRELEQTVQQYKQQLEETTLSLAEFKSRALQAEVLYFFCYSHKKRRINCNQVQLQETSSNIERTTLLEKEVKEKTLLIGKLRHEGSVFDPLITNHVVLIIGLAIILNEHLTEAIRRLRRDASDNNVDRFAVLLCT